MFFLVSMCRMLIGACDPMLCTSRVVRLLEFSMDNTGASRLDRSCIGFKFAGGNVGPAGLISNNRARTAFAYIWDDECWASQTYPWSGVSAEGSSCAYSGQSMSANGYTGLVMDVALTTGRVVTTTTASTSALSSSSSSSSSSSTSATTVPRGGGTSTPPAPPPRRHKDDNDANDTGKNIAIEFAVLFAVCTICLIPCVAMQRLALRDAREKLQKYEAVGARGTGAAVAVVVRNTTYDDVTRVTRVDDNAGLIANDDGTCSSSA